MTERKRTPDILGELMSGAEVPEEPAALSLSPAPARAAAPRPKAAKSSASKQVVKNKTKATAPAVFPRSTGWEYLCASFQYYKGEPPAWRARFENGRELDDWFIGPPLDEYLRQMGVEGWELCAASAGERMHGAGDTRQLYFKRPMPPNE